MARDARFYLDQAEHYFQLVSTAPEDLTASEAQRDLRRLVLAQTASWIAMAANAVEMADLARLLSKIGSRAYAFAHATSQEREVPSLGHLTRITAREL